MLLGGRRHQRVLNGAAAPRSGRLLAVVITAASVQDRDGARPLRWNLHRSCRHVRIPPWADRRLEHRRFWWDQLRKTEKTHAGT